MSARTAVAVAPGGHAAPCPTGGHMPAYPPTTLPHHSPAHRHHTHAYTRIHSLTTAHPCSACAALRTWLIAAFRIYAVCFINIVCIRAYQVRPPSPPPWCLVQRPWRAHAAQGRGHVAPPRPSTPACSGACARLLFVSASSLLVLLIGAVVRCACRCTWCRSACSNGSPSGG